MLASFDWTRRKIGVMNATTRRGMITSTTETYFSSS